MSEMDTGTSLVERAREAVQSVYGAFLLREAEQVERAAQGDER